MYYAYILRSLKNGKHYFGSCEDLQKRLSIHNAGKVRSSKSGIPYIVLYSETYETRSAAFQREMYFKTLEGRNWLKINKII